MFTWVIMLKIVARVSSSVGFNGFSTMSLVVVLYEKVVQDNKRHLDRH